MKYLCVIGLLCVSSTIFASEDLNGSNPAVKKAMDAREVAVKQADELLQKKIEVLQNEHDKFVSGVNKVCIAQLKRAEIVARSMKKIDEADTIKELIDTISSGVSPTTTVTNGTNGASIAISTDFPVVLRPLQAKEKRWLTGNPGQIASVSTELSGLVFLQIPDASSPTYKISVRNDGFIYCFGGDGGDSIEKQLDKSKVEVLGSKITGASLGQSNTYKIKVSKGETFVLSGRNVMIAAKEILSVK